METTDTQETPEFTLKGFVAAVDEAYLGMRRPNGFTQKKTFSPSSLGYSHGTCPRYWYIAFSGEVFEEDIDSGAVAKMHHGTISHGKIEEIVQKLGHPVEIEKEIKFVDPPIRGFVDFIIDWAGEKVVGEYKTAAQEVFLFRKTNKNVTPYHLVQILMYLKALGIDKGIVLYENKNTQELLPVEVKLSDYAEYADYLFTWMREVRAAYDGETIPNRPFPSRKSKECKNCPVQRPCYDKWREGEVTLLPLEVRK